MTVIPRERRKVNTHTNSRYLRELRRALSLSEIQRKVLFGTLMGDACLISTADGKNYRLQIEHGDKQKEYLYWKYEIFREFVVTPPKYIPSLNSWRFRTISHKEFRELRDVFYSERRKILPAKLNFLVDSLTLAVWFMDDGGRLGNGCLLNIQNLTDNEALVVQRFFREEFEILATLQRNKGRFRLYIPTKDRVKWEILLGDNLREEFEYKLKQKILRSRRDLVASATG